jgi:hypothetical protein
VRRFLCLVVLGTVASVVGCGSDSGTATPPEQCEAILDDFCGRAADCVVQLGCDPGHSRDDENQACLTSAQQVSMCGKATSVGPSYAACINDVQTIACSAFGSSTLCVAPPLPADCQGVIGTQ